MTSLRVERTARERFGLASPRPDPRGDLRVGDPATLRRLAARMNAARPTGGASVGAGELAALALLHEIAHLVVERFEELAGAETMADAADDVRTGLGRPGARLLSAYEAEFPTADGRPELDAERLTELVLTRLSNENPALGPLRPLVDDRTLAATRAYDPAIERLDRFFASLPPIGDDGETLLELLRAPARAHPTSLAGQLRYIRDRWRRLLGDRLDALTGDLDLALGILAEEERAMHLRFGGGPGDGPVEPPSFEGLEAEPERFSPDREWMPTVVLQAKSTYVWLDQLSRRHGRTIRTLDAVPDEELDRLAGAGITGLWLIGLWQRSRASETIKRWRGQADAVASAYSLDDYRIADDLGGEAAWAELARRAWTRGIRLASDMVPNHMGIDSRWVIEHPERFLSLPEPPFPAYTYGGADLSPDRRVAIRIEDHYWDGSDAAVVFQRVDTSSGEARYIYHGNDGTSTPWNDTAQLDYSRADVREAVIQTILAVARRFPIIRFDAAMTLAKRHIERLWFPLPGHGGAIPSRTEHAMTKAAFDRAMPHEFWRDVVDRVAAEVPDTLLLAEAFWLMEGYFVRTLGMHRVYNSAFMHMLRDEDGAGYRRVLRDTLEFDPEILKRYVNFMTNPDEKTAIEQFGTGDKYLGVATLLATLPGLPMVGHGQVEGFTEKYGMEFRRASLDEAPDSGLVERHERWIFPLLHRRRQFAEAHDFLLYDLVRDDGGVEDHVYAYSNGTGGDRSLVVYHNRFAETAGWIRESVPYSVPDGNGGRRLVRRTLAEGWGLSTEPGLLIRAHDVVSGLEHLWRADALRDHGLRLELQAYERHVFLDVAEVRDPDGTWAVVADGLGGRGVASLDAERDRIRLAPVHDAIGSLLGDLAILGLVRDGRAPDPAALADRFDAVAEAIRHETRVDGPTAAIAVPALDRLVRLAAFASASGGRRRREPSVADPIAPVRSAFRDPWHRAVLTGWALLEPLGRLAPGDEPDRTSRAWYGELRLAPVVAGALGHSGLDAAGALRAADRIGRLIGLPRPSRAGEPAGLVAALLADPAAGELLGRNTWEGVEYVTRDGWREALDWAFLLDLVDGADPAATATVVAQLVDAGERAGYRVDGLVSGLEAADRRTDRR